MCSLLQLVLDIDMPYPLNLSLCRLHSIERVASHDRRFRKIILRGQFYYFLPTTMTWWPRNVAIEAIVDALCFEIPSRLCFMPTDVIVTPLQGENGRSCFASGDRIAREVGSGHTVLTRAEPCRVL